MREHLRNEIIHNVTTLILHLESHYAEIRSDQGRLRTFSDGDTMLEKTENIPRYAGSIRDRVKYKQIEKEVKCGKYYLRILVDQRDGKKTTTHKSGEVIRKITIPASEESDYLANLRDSFAGILQRLKREIMDQVGLDMKKDIKDLTYTLKACLYACESFKNKEFICQDQVVDLI